MTREERARSSSPNNLLQINAMGRAAKYQGIDACPWLVATFLTVADPSLSWGALGSSSAEGVESGTHCDILGQANTLWEHISHTFLGHCDIKCDTPNSKLLPLASKNQHNWIARGCWHQLGRKMRCPESVGNGDRKLRRGADGGREGWRRKLLSGGVCLQPQHSAIRRIKNSRPASL